MGLITLFKLICLLLFIIAMVLSLYETIKVFMYFNKETKKRKIPREEYYLKARKMGLYYLAFIIASFFYGLSSAF